MSRDNPTSEDSNQDIYSDLPETVREHIKEHCSTGLAKSGEDAIYEWEQAAYLLPDPKEEWGISCWLFSHIGEVYFSMRDFEASDEFFRWAISSPGGRTNYHLYLRLGESCLELENKEEAMEFLLNAYEFEPSCFEKEDSKYLSFIKDHAKE